MADLIWDDRIGDQLAWIENGEVFSIATKQKIATVRERQLYDLEGKPLNLYLNAASVVTRDGNGVPNEFKKLCTG